MAPFFLGSLYRQLNLVYADLARSLGRCVHLSMVHTSFFLAYFFEHFHTAAPVSRTFLASANRSRAEQWFGTSSDVSWYKVCDIAANFTPRPYSFASPGVVGIGQCLLPVSSSISAASGGDSIARAVINSTLITLPGWLPFLNNEASGVTVYHPDRFARQLSFDQGVPGAAPPMPSLAESQLRFTQPHTSGILAQLGDLPIPARDNVGHYTAEFHLFWRRNLDTFLTFMQGESTVPEEFAIRTRDTSLQAATKARRGDWRGPHSRWAVTEVVPLNRGFPPVPPPAPPVAARRASARGTWGRTQPPAPAKPSQPSSSQVPAVGGSLRRKRIHTVHFLLPYTPLILLYHFIILMPSHSKSLFQQRELDASTFVAFKLGAAAEEAEEQVVVEEAEENATTALAKRRRLEGKFFLLHCHFRRLPFWFLILCLVETS